MSRVLTLLRRRGSGSAPAPAAPPSSGLVAWFQPESLQGLAHDSVLSSWTNSVEGGPAAVQATGTRQPKVAANVLDGYSAAWIDPASSSPGSRLLSCAIAGDRNSLTFLCVTKKTAEVEGSSLRTHFGTSGGAATFYGHTLRNQVYAGSARTPFQARSTGQWQIQGFAADGSVLQFVRNGQIINPHTGEQALVGADDGTLTGLSSSPFTSLALLNDSSAGSTAARGYMVEALVWNRRLSQEEITQATAYLDAKYPSVLANENNVVCVGDSLTFGLGAVSGNEYPFKLGQNAAMHDAHVMTWGWAGRWAAQEVLTAPTYLFPNHADGGQRHPKARRNILCVWYGANDLAPVAGNRTVAQMQADITQLITLAKAAGWTVGLSTVIPRGDSDNAAPADAGAYSGNGNFEWRRAQYNAWVLAGNSGADFVVDPTALAPFDEAADYLNTTYYNADTVHLQAAGYQVIADAWAAALAPQL